MTHRLNLEGGRVVVTGNADGYPVTLEGNIKNVTIKAERDCEHNGWDRKFFLSDRTNYFLEFDTDNENGTAYTLKVPTVQVLRTATVQAADRTVEALEKAREAVGAPKNARVRMGNIMKNEGLVIVDEPTPIEVEFRWTENVRTK